MAGDNPGSISLTLEKSIILLEPPQLDVSNSSVGVPVINPTASGPYSN